MWTSVRLCCAARPARCAALPLIASYSFATSGWGLADITRRVIQGAFNPRVVHLKWHSMTWRATSTRPSTRHVMQGALNPRGLSSKALRAVSGVPIACHVIDKHVAPLFLESNSIP
jgi:hypothetical protein